MVLKIVYNSEVQSKFYEELIESLKSYPDLEIESYDSKYLKDKKKGYKVKGAFSSRLDPFVGIYTDKPIKGFYSEANECTVKNIINYLDEYE